MSLIKNNYIRYSKDIYRITKSRIATQMYAEIERLQSEGVKPTIDRFCEACNTGKKEAVKAKRILKEKGLLYTKGYSTFLLPIKA